MSDANDPDEEEIGRRLDEFKKAASKPQGPVEAEIQRLEEEIGPAMEHNLRLMLQVVLGEPASEEEWASFKQSMSATLPILKSLSATVRYLENEAVRRKAWETEIERLIERLGTK